MISPETSRKLLICVRASESFWYYGPASGGQTLCGGGLLGRRAEQEG
jgi:hypothetical protein